MAISLDGIYAAAITPFDAKGQPAHDQLIAHLQHLEKRGCHGVLLAGTTGEGPSLSVQERTELFVATACANTGLRLLAGTGAASLEDVVALTHAAFDSGIPVAVIVPPFFYRNASLEGLCAFYGEVVRRAVPGDGLVLLYHNPVVTSVGVSFDLIRRLRDAFPSQVIGIKDSSANWDHTRALLEAFPDFQVLVGDDRLLAKTLEAGGAGAITGVTNVFPDLLCDVYRLCQQGKPPDEAQGRVTEACRQFDGLPRIAALKRLLMVGGIIQSDGVRPPLSPLTADELARLAEHFHLKIGVPPVVNLADLLGDD